MNVCDQYSHRKALEKIQNKRGLFREIKDILNCDELSFGVNSTKEIKTRINEMFNQKGWADKVKVGNSNLTISFLKSKVGVCFQCCQNVC